MRTLAILALVAFAGCTSASIESRPDGTAASATIIAGRRRRTRPKWPRRSARLGTGRGNFVFPNERHEATFRGKLQGASLIDDQWCCLENLGSTALTPDPMDSLGDKKAAGMAVDNFGQIMGILDYRNIGAKVTAEG